MKSKSIKLLAVATLSAMFAIGGIPSGMAMAATHCSSGGTCGFDGTSYSVPSYRNTTGHIANLGSVGFDNKFSSVSDSTSSSSYQGVTFYGDLFCGTNTGSWFLPRGTEVASGAGSWDNILSSFRLILNNGNPIAC